MNETLITIAKACGGDGPWLQKHYQGRGGLYWCNDKGETLHEYETLDGMQSAVLMQDEKFQNEFECKMECMCEDRFYHQLTVTDWQVSFVGTLQQLKRI